ncbi:MAG: ribosome maturation factor RimM [Woeseiaceae bacterium]|nr:ribosome maturation factor RimM [Woeseiaceae bacterium]
MTDAEENLGSDAVILGRISGLFGVRGWIKVFSYTDPREAVLQYRRWWLGRRGNWHPASLCDGKRHGRSVIASLDGVGDREAAAELVGLDIAVKRQELPEPAPGSYYWRDLKGMEVVHRDGTELGSVAYLMETGANDVLVVRGDTERLIPFVTEEVILDVDLAAGRILVDWEWD